MADEEEAALLLPRANEDARVKTKVWNDASPLKDIERIKPSLLLFRCFLDGFQPTFVVEGWYYVLLRKILYM